MRAVVGIELNNGGCNARVEQQRCAERGSEGARTGGGGERAASVVKRGQWGACLRGRPHLPCGARTAAPGDANERECLPCYSAKICFEILSVISDYRGPGGKEQLTRAQLTWVEPKRVSISGINIKSSTFASDSASEFATCTTSTQKLRRWTRYVLR